MDSSQRQQRKQVCAVLTCTASLAFPQTSHASVSSCVRELPSVSVSTCQARAQLVGPTPAQAA
eukprot:1704524-Rhodomonas_salina.2